MLFMYQCSILSLSASAAAGESSAGLGAAAPVLAAAAVAAAHAQPQCVVVSAQSGLAACREARGDLAGAALVRAHHLMCLS